MINKNFPKEERLLIAKDFDYLKGKSKSFASGLFVFYVKHSRLSLSQTRIGISVSKKCGKSVRRNGFKRRIREFYRLSQYRELGKDILIVLNAKKLKNLSEEDLKKKIFLDLGSGFEKISHS